MKRIDAHHHFWRYSPEEYGWISADTPVLRRDYLFEDLQVVAAGAGVEGAVSVQARQTVGETRWLLELAGQHELIRGVVGWVPLIAPDVERVLAELSKDPKLRGVRHVLHDEPDDHYMLRDDFTHGVARLKTHRLCYDILIFERHLPQTVQFVDRHPQQVFILDHIAKPRIRDREIATWRRLIQELAKRSNVYCKVSGMVTEADHRSWTAQQLRPYFDAVLEAFTPRRLMFGSDWPVCLLASSYQRWIDTVDHWTCGLGDSERERIFRGTAEEAYALQGMA
jgi:L-fuconolactonase